MPDPGFSLGGLLDQEDLDLRLVVGDEECLQRNVVGVHGTEIEHPARWLDPGWVMLTTGMRLRGREAAQRELIAELDESGMTALGFGVKMTFDEIPAGIIAEAEARDFPLFEVPYATAFSEVSAFAARSMLSQDFYVLRRIVSMQNHLMSSLNAPAPEEELVRRLSKLLDSTVVLYRPDGRLEVFARPGQNIAATKAPAWSSQVWEAVCEREASLQHFHHDHLKVVSAPVDADGHLRSWLVLVTRLDHTFEHLARPMVESAVRLLAVIATARQISTAEERAHQALLIEQVMSAGLVEADGLDQRVAELGLDLSTPARALQLAAREGEAVDLPEVASRLEHHFASLHLPLLLAQRDDRLIVFTQIENAQLDQVIEELRTDLRNTIVGIGRAASSISELGSSASDAAVAIEQLRGESGRDVLHFEDFELSSWLMTHPETDAVEAKVEQTLSDLKAKPQLYETVRCYLRHDLDVIATAKALNLHANSLRYRLTKVEEVLGASLRKPATIANLYLAITLDSLAADARPTRDDAVPIVTVPPSSSAEPR
jgi:purine catabolism regulator